MRHARSMYCRLAPNCEGARLSPDFAAELRPQFFPTPWCIQKLRSQSGRTSGERYTTGRSEKCSNPHIVPRRGMNEALFGELPAWLTEAGLAGTPETEIVSGFCDRCVAAGLPLARALVLIDTLHPVHEGPPVPLERRPRRAPLLEYGRTSPDALAAAGSNPRPSRRPSAGGAAHSTGCCKPATRFCAAA